jgi:hypothetical protein
MMNCFKEWREMLQDFFLLHEHFNETVELCQVFMLKEKILSLFTFLHETLE